ncbi:MAG: 23S rRNA (pseudouridine(1915)-N(3))-methyltransferase RlmH [Victivallales bacterium]|nr:23S rRNA (pseudouridine(1915)-N(3))-methyltransferase RlmH [Victivallales bacterium]
MKVLLIVVGKTTDKRIEALTAEYVQRASHYVPLQVEVIPDVKATKGQSSQSVKDREGEAVLRLLQDGDCVVLLDERGKEMRSMEYAKYLEKKMHSGARRLVFVVGGAFGFSEQMYARANEMMSLSKMTFTHQMVRLFFAEQYYRAMTILKGEPYHNE